MHHQFDLCVWRNVKKEKNVNSMNGMIFLSMQSVLHKIASLCHTNDMLLFAEACIDVCVAVCQVPSVESLEIMCFGCQDI